MAKRATSFLIYLLGTVATAASASAQQVSAPPADATSIDATPAQTTVQKAGKGTEEIVVTAQKREQRLQDVPVSVSVVSGYQLVNQGVTDATQLQYTVPGLTYTAGPAPAYAIRGIGTETYSRTASSDVAVVVDGVVQGQPQPPSNSLFDIQRVETLSGPQGMLFGKNASAGLINIVTNTPDPGEFTSAFHTDLGENGYQVYQATENVPLSGNSALRISAFSNGQDARLFNRFDNRPVDQHTDYGGRARYLFSNENVTVNVIADYEHDHGATQVWTVRRAGSLAPLLAACGVTAGPDNTDLCLDGPTSRNTDSYGLSAQIDVPIGAYTLTSITADRQFTSQVNADSDAVALNFLDLNYVREFDNQFSQELRITSPAGRRLEYVAGLYYYDFSYKYNGEQAGTLGFFPSPILLDAPTQHAKEYSDAAFAQATFHVWNGLSLIGGMRETRDAVSSIGYFPCVASLGTCIPGLTALGPQDAKVTHYNLSYRVGAQYRFDDDSMVYLTDTRGYKGPAINTPYAGNITPTIVKAETPTYVEAGIKQSLFDRALTVNVAAFHDIVRNFQAQTLNTQTTPSYFTFANASKLKSEGIEVDFYARPAQGLRLDGGIIYNYAIYGDFLSQCTSVCTGVVNVKGNQLAGAPRWQMNFNGEYARPLIDGYDGFIATNVSWRSDASTNPVKDPNEVIKAYALVNGRIGIRSDDGRYTLAFFARNLFDKRFPTVIFPDPVSGGRNYDQAFSPDAFRVLGASLDINF